MRKLLIFALFTVSFTVYGQTEKYNLRIDTVTYQYYMKGDWDKLIDTAKQAIKENIDFKHLEQRLGYAYFIKGDYYASEYYYERALKYDKNDINTKSYLYYCALYFGNTSLTRYRGGELTQLEQKSYSLKPFKLVNTVDLEYNYKSNSVIERGNPVYFRGGIETQLGYRLSLYQAYSTYNQTNKSTYTDNSNVQIPVNSIDSTKIRQNEYFALINWTITPHLSLNVGYHNINSILNNRYTFAYKIGNQQFKTTKDTVIHLPGNMLCSKLTYTINRFDIGLSGSVMSYDSILTQQYGVHMGVILPGKLNIYLKSSLYGKFDSKNNNRIIFSQSAGALLIKNLWVEGDVVLGNLNYFSDNNGLYIYNSLDPTTFRTGLSIFWKIIPNLSVFGNYTFDTKLIEDKNTTYNQHSFSSGIIWKI